MIAQGFTYSQIVNRMAFTPRDIFDAAQEVLDAVHYGGDAGGGPVAGSDDDIPF